MPSLMTALQVIGLIVGLAFGAVAGSALAVYLLNKLLKDMFKH